MNDIYRAIISLATVFPLSITFTYLYADWIVEQLPSQLTASLIDVNYLQFLLVFVVIVFKSLYWIRDSKIFEVFIWKNRRCPRSS